MTYHPRVAKPIPALQKATPAPDLPPEIMEQENVHSAYGKIAGHFSLTRTRTWPAVQFFIQNYAGKALLDAGCGNGRNLQHCAANTVGIDFCYDFCEITQQNTQASVACADVIQMPFKDAVFDAVISIAVIHHLASPERRKRALEEICRVLKPHGRAMVCVWAEQPGVSKDALVPWTQQILNPTHALEKDATAGLPRQGAAGIASNADLLKSKDGSATEGTEQFEQVHSSQASEPQMKRSISPQANRCIDAPGISGQEIVKTGRYYHFFDAAELSDLGAEAGLSIDQVTGRAIWERTYGQKCELRDCYFDCGNWYCIFQK